MKDEEFTMIIKCPECSTGFAIKEELLPPEGRKVKCSKCAHVWLQRRPWVKPELDDMPDFKVRHPLRPVLSKQPKGSNPVLNWVLFMCVVGATLGSMYGFRDLIVATFPQTHVLYDTLSLPVKHPMPLKFTDIEVKKGIHPDEVVISGTIVNLTSKMQPVPPLLLLPKSGKKTGPIFYAAKDKLNPGEKCTFRTTLVSEFIDKAGMSLRFTVQDDD